MLPVLTTLNTKVESMEIISQRKSKFATLRLIEICPHFLEKNWGSFIKEEKLNSEESVIYSLNKVVVEIDKGEFEDKQIYFV